MQIRSGTKCALTTALGMMVVLTASGANANGRFPRGEHIIEYPSDPNRIVLAATYGLVVTDDAKSWYHVCEAGFSLFPPPAGSDPGYTGDPQLALTADESILAGVQTRITKSTDRGCGWAKSFEDPNLGVDDIAIAPSNRNIAVALVRQKGGGGGSQVYETTDAGTTWKPIGTPLNTLVVGYTIDVDPKDPNHIMVTGLTTFDPVPQSGVFLSSTNHGMTWTSSPIPNTNLDAAPYIAAVHPTDGTKVFVRTDSWLDDGAGAMLARDTLYYSKDSGQTWTALLQPTGVDGNGAKLYGFALSPNGDTVLAGFGDPVEGGGRNVDRDVMGVYKSTGADYSFGTMPKPVFDESATCITWTAKGIYICGSPQGMTSYIAFGSDVSKVTNTGLTKIMEVAKLKGEPPCCSGRATAVCDWNTECMRFFACNDAATGEEDAGMCMMPEPGREGGAGTDGGAADASADRSTGDSGGAGGAGTGGATSGGTGGATSGGTGGATSGGTAGSGTGGGTGGSGGSDDGCSCRITTGSQQKWPAALGLLLGLIGASRLRRSRSGKERAARTD